jgi:translation initiation factor IF-1
MHEKEIIRLDARVVGVIGNSAFRAQLANGHPIVAFMVGPDKAKTASLGLGEVVQVEMSPYDMSRGRIHLNKEQRQR